MSENQPPSGSRWEPAPADAQHHDQATGLLEPPPARPVRPARGRRLLVAAAGAALLLVGGVSGYALGHATAGTGAPTVREHRDGGPGGLRGVPGGAPDGTRGGGTDDGGTGPST